MIIAFVYNGGEGSLVALPIVRKTMEAYFGLKSLRAETSVALDSGQSNET